MKTFNKIIVIGLIFPFLLFANNNVFEEEQTTTKQSTNEKEIDPTVDLESIQTKLETQDKSFKSHENFLYDSNKTYKIHARMGMKNFIILDKDVIADFHNGLPSAFEIKKVQAKKYSLKNHVLYVKPLAYGIDTNLVVFGESGKVYSFYIYSTDHKTETIPNLINFVSAQEPKLNDLQVVNYEEEKFKKLIKEDEKNEEMNQSNVMLIGEGKAKLTIQIEKIQRGYEQDGAEDLKADEIFNDEKFTYFRYDKESHKKFPVIYRVVDGYDNPITTRIVGEYIVAETISKGFTLRIGDKHTCVRKVKDE